MLHTLAMYMLYTTHRLQLRTGAMAIVRPDTLSTTMSLVTLWIVCIQYVCVWASECANCRTVTITNLIGFSGDTDNV